LLDTFRAGEFRTTDFSYPEGNANVALWLSRTELSQDGADLDRVQERIRAVRLNEDNTTRVPRWTLAEVLWTEADMQLKQGHKKDGLDVAIRGTKLFSETDLVPTAVLAPDFVRKYRERYPKDLYVIPRQAARLQSFRHYATRVLRYLRLDLY
jgi:hypothetical protein